MNTTNQLTVMERLYGHFSNHQSSSLSLLAHLTVKAIRHLSEWLVHNKSARESALGFVTQQPKFVTVIQLIAAAATFGVYFFALGFALQELGVNLTGYLASALIVALAISFGSQGLATGGDTAND